jgi:hypothetical protein
MIYQVSAQIWQAAATAAGPCGCCLSLSLMLQHSSSKLLLSRLVQRLLCW